MNVIMWSEILLILSPSVRFVQICALIDRSVSFLMWCLLHSDGFPLFVHTQKKGTASEFDSYKRVVSCSVSSFRKHVRFLFLISFEDCTSILIRVLYDNLDCVSVQR